MKSIIKIENLSKQYRLGLVGTGTLSHDLKRWWHLMRGKEDPYLKIGETNDRSSKSNSEYVWALKDINLEVMPGEVLGIIGKNGAGKSTLLKILSKVTGPTTGKITYNGRIGSLLEVGTGFHPELTGSENIYLNGAILGMHKKEIDRKFDEIVDFSGCERYIDTPVKRYSSGMMVRLGFAVAAHLEPEILVVDEVLAVGDAEFQKKAIGKMQDVSKNEGRTVLFVSHNMAAVRNLCGKAVLLENGNIINRGSADRVVNTYLSGKSGIQNVYYPTDNIVKEISVRQKRNSIELCLKFIGEKVLKNPNFGFVFLDKYENPIFGADPIRHGVTYFGKPANEKEIKATVISPLFIDGTYFISIYFSDGVAHNEHIFRKEKCLSVEISDMNPTVMNQKLTVGPISPICTWKY